MMAIAICEMLRSNRVGSGRAGSAPARSGSQSGPGRVGSGRVRVGVRVGVGSGRVGSGRVSQSVRVIARRSESYVSLSVHVRLCQSFGLSFSKSLSVILSVSH